MMQDLVLIILYLAVFAFAYWLLDVKQKIVRLVTFGRDHPQAVHAGLAVIILGPVVIWFIYTVWWQGVKLILWGVEKVWLALT